MTPNKYQKTALRTESPLPWMKADDNSLRILHGLMGLNGEAGEAIDIFKKHLFQGHALEKVMQMNLDKLAARYPDGFESEKSQHRASEDV